MYDQLSAHKAAVSLFQRYKKGGDLQNWPSDLRTPAALSSQTALRRFPTNALLPLRWAAAGDAKQDPGR
jgi:hypothetical protein